MLFLLQWVNTYCLWALIWQNICQIDTTPTKHLSDTYQTSFRFCMVPTRYLSTWQMSFVRLTDSTYKKRMYIKEDFKTLIFTHSFNIERKGGLRIFNRKDKVYWGSYIHIYKRMRIEYIPEEGKGLSFSFFFFLSEYLW